MFKLFTVAETLDPVKATGGMIIVPDYTFETAPAAKVVVIPAQSAADDAHPLCPVCDMEVAKATSPSLSYRKRIYCFCMEEHRAMFEAGPAAFLG